MLLDPGSQSNLITKVLVELRLSPNTVNVPISGLNQNKTHITHSIMLEIQSQYNNKRMRIECLILPKITGKGNTR